MIYVFGSIFLKHPRNPALNPAWDHLLQIFFRNVISGFPCTMYSYCNFLSVKIRFQQNDKLSISQKSPQTPPKSSPKLGLAPSSSIFFSEMFLVGSHLLCIHFAAFYLQKYDFDSMIKKKLLNFSKKVIFCPSAGRQECPGPPNS